MRNFATMTAADPKSKKPLLASNRVDIDIRPGAF
jgi:hypothetical protein